MKKDLSSLVLAGSSLLLSLICLFFLIINIYQSFDSKKVAFEAGDVPVSFQADYISFSNYISRVYEIEDYKMPGLSVVNGEIDCAESDLDPLSSVIRNEVVVSKREINGKKYCVMYSMKGDSGSLVAQNSYTTVIDDKVYLINFLAKYNDCYDYSEEDIFECRAERQDFDLDLLVDKEIERIR